MKFFLITAALVAVAVAGPIQPGNMGPTPIEDLDLDSPAYVGPAIVEQKEIPAPVIQIILNVNSQGQVEVNPEIVQVPEEIEQSPIPAPGPAFPSPQPAPIEIPEGLLPVPQPSPVIQEADSLN
ncbi:hypothetical protein KGM_215707 [Danaus plexippus plexippus]|uniref:Uncharacterized protein n=1 Tax=Danaus plexippus plexippus TaxID=278856 RepID=A0A212EHH9_DANPL|nr:hypothetical protein KGM_215707 [Danaus plexippus plexippus]